MRFVLVGLLIMLAGCGERAARYQIEVNGNTTWRLDTQTGALEACGFEQGKPTCTTFPDAKR